MIDKTVKEIVMKMVVITRMEYRLFCTCKIVYDEVILYAIRSRIANRFETRLFSSSTYC